MSCTANRKVQGTNVPNRWRLNLIKSVVATREHADELIVQCMCVDFGVVSVSMIALMISRRVLPLISSLDWIHPASGCGDTSYERDYPARRD